MQRDDFIKTFINSLTSSRIVLSIILLFVVPFSPAFFAVYLLCGASDILDGFLARHFHKESEFGAKLDSIADAVLAISLAIIVIKNITFPMLLWESIIFIFLVRCAGYIVGYLKFHTFASLHTYLNKATGSVIFAFPLLLYVFGLNVAAIVTCVVAFVSSLEELIITIKAKELDRDCKGILFKLREKQE